MDGLLLIIYCYLSDIFFDFIIQIIYLQCYSLTICRSDQWLYWWFYDDLFTFIRTVSYRLLPFILYFGQIELKSWRIIYYFLVLRGLNKILIFFIEWVDRKLVLFKLLKVAIGQRKFLFYGASYIFDVLKDLFINLTKIRHW